MYAVTASIRFDVKGGWEGVKHLPTFYLHPNVQGILNEDQAVKVARSILDPFDRYIGRINITATKVD